MLLQLNIGEDLFVSQFCLLFTVWKFQDFSITQILCEINYGICESYLQNLPFVHFLFVMDDEKAENEAQHVEVVKQVFINLLARRE